MNYCNIESSAIIQSFNVRLEHPVNGKKYVTIGENSIINGSYIFESQDGHVSIGNHCYIGFSTFISRTHITIGNNVTIAWGCTIYDHNSHSTNYLTRRQDIDDQLMDLRNGNNSTTSKDWRPVKTAPIIIDDDVWIGMNCIILKGVHIGEGAIVSAGSVLTHDVDPWTVVSGNPAKFVRKLK